MPGRYPANTISCDMDGIDRLTPEQTLVIFRLVKSVGRLPNVVYLLAFDTTLAECLVAERYPADRYFS
jgi:predicted KAP-like P-loop ATPase